MLLFRTEVFIREVGDAKVWRRRVAGYGTAIAIGRSREDNKEALIRVYECSLMIVSKSFGEGLR